MPLTEDERGTGVGVAIDLINTWDELEPEPDLLDRPGVLRRRLDWHGLHDAAARVTDADVERARELRARLAAVFDAADEAEAAELLNELVREYGTAPQLERVDGEWRLRYWPEDANGLDAVAAYAAAGLLEALRDVGFERFGRCAGAPCRCAFVDRSRNRTRIYCCNLCADRVAQAQYRRRRKERSAS